MALKIIPLGLFGQRFEVKNQIDIEFVMEHLTRKALFHIRSGTPYSGEPVNRGVKDKLIRGVLGAGN
jgi:hypothetical protein